MFKVNVMLYLVIFFMATAAKASEHDLLNFTIGKETYILSKEYLQSLSLYRDDLNPLLLQVELVDNNPHCFPYLSSLIERNIDNTMVTRFAGITVVSAVIQSKFTDPSFYMSVKSKQQAIAIMDAYYQ